MSQGSTFRRSAVAALFWSLLQNWGGRTIGMVVFVMLARTLMPQQFGVASSAFLVMNLLSLITEFGIGDVLVQRPGLTSTQVNLPFYLSLCLSILLAATAALLSGHIAGAMGVPRLAPYLVAALAICPFLTAQNFQDAMYRRELRYQQLAIRTLASLAAGGVVGIGLALLGAGTWALIAQFATQTLVGVAWLWRHPVWKPTGEIDRASAKQMFRFGANIVGFRLVDFFTTRSVDLVVLVVYGPAALGLFTVSSRLSQLLLQLLQASINNVGLSMLSRVVDDRERLQRLFVRSTSLCATLGTPVFFGLAALAPEVNRIMFGARWAGADQVMVPLLLIGGVYCIQFIFGSYLIALGRPNLIFVLVVFKAAVVLPPLYFMRMPSVYATASLYALTLFLETPLAVHITLRALSLRWRALLQPVGTPMAIATLAFGAVWMGRHELAAPRSVFLAAILYGVIFATSYLAGLALLARRTALDNFTFLRTAVKR